MEEKKKSSIISLDANEYTNIQHAMKKVDRDAAFHFQFESEQEYVDWLIKDAMRSMLEKVKKTGTSQDPEEWTDPPVWTEPHERKGFVVLVVYYRKKYRGLARSMDGQFDLMTSWYEDKNSAGKEIVKYIDMFRKQSKPKVLDQITEMQLKRKRIREIQNMEKSLVN